MDKGRNVKLEAPIDISFGAETHAEYFAAERGTGQLTDLRTFHWEMKDDWWDAAGHFSYNKPKELSGGAESWLTKIKQAHCGKMTGSDGANLDSVTKKCAPHFDEKWGKILNQAVIKGTGIIENTEEIRKDAIAERENKVAATKQKRGAEEAARLNAISGAGVTGIGYYDGDPEEYPGMTQAEARSAGMNWRED